MGVCQSTEEKEMMFKSQKIDKEIERCNEINSKIIKLLLLGYFL